MIGPTLSGSVRQVSYPGRILGTDMRRRGWSRMVWVFAMVLGSTYGSVFGGSHLWRFSEVYSNVDGTIQFIELRECCGSDFEVLLDGKWVSSEATEETFWFDRDLDPPTGNRYLLLGTPGFAALPGAPAPDFIIQENLFSLGGDTLRYAGYPEAIMSWQAGQVPIDGRLALNVDGTTSVNSPTNYAGESGSVLIVTTPATTHWGLLVTMLLFVTAWTVFVMRNRLQRPSTSVAG
ncbi:MAG: hypothetical protein PVI86_00640 [Phycisphaerae bacterium]